MFIAIVFFFSWLSGKLGQVTNCTIVGGTLSTTSISTWFRFTFGGDTAMPGGLHTRLCHAFLVFGYVCHPYTPC